MKTTAYRTFEGNLYLCNSNAAKLCKMQICPFVHLDFKFLLHSASPKRTSRRKFFSTVCKNIAQSRLGDKVLCGNACNANWYLTANLWKPLTHSTKDNFYKKQQPWMCADIRKHTKKQRPACTIQTERRCIATAICLADCVKEPTTIF